jgi:hypothetical protein
MDIKFTLDDVQALRDTSKWDVGPNGKFISVQKNTKWKGYITSITGRSLVPRPSMNTRLIFVQQSNWPLDAATDDELLRTCAEIEKALGVAMAGSPTSVGLRYLEKMNTRYYEHYFEKSTEVAWDEMKTAHIPFHAWFPAIPSIEGYFLHCFDRNSSQPYAASQENMGVGKPEMIEGGWFEIVKGKPALPGLWDVEIDASGVDMAGLPPLFPKGRVWYPTPLLRVAAYAGCKIQVNQGMVWPEGKPIFERWTKDLWKLRQQYPDGSMERQSVKSIMNNVVGSTRIGEEMDRTMRPDWYATVIGSERAVVWYKAYALRNKYKVHPVGAYADALYYLSMHEKPELAVPTMLDNKNSLGGYKLAWTLNIDKNGREVLGEKMGAANRIGELKKLVKIYE